MEQVLKLALRSAEQAEVIMDEGESRSIDFENNKLKYVDTHSGRAIGVRVVKKGRIGFSSTTDISKPERLVQNALASAEFGQEAKFEFPSTGSYPTVKVLDKRVTDFPITDGIAMEQAAVDHILSARPDVKTNSGIGKSTGSRRLINSRGLDVRIESTSFGIHLETLWVRDSGLIWVGEGEGSHQIATDLMKHANKIIHTLKLAEKEIKVPTGSYPVIFTPKCVHNVLATFLVGANGKLLQKGASPLKDRLGERIADERVSLWDNPLLDFAPGSTPMDGEGIACRPMPIIENGVFMNFYYDLQTAGLMNTKSTGNGMRGAGSQPGPGTTNTIVRPGDPQGGAQSFDAMIRGMKRGLIVDQTLGGGQSNVLAGDVSVNINVGFLVENGEIAGRVKDCMVACNVFEAFKRVIAISDTPEWHGSLFAPAIQFDALSVAGMQ
jgi:PmbA protein